MNSLLHALNIGTLAAWLSVVGFGSVGALLPGWQSLPKRIQPEKLETLTVTPDLTIGDEGQDDAATFSPPDFSPASLPGPPALPNIARAAPLPAIPDLPVALSISPAARSASRPAASSASGKTGASSLSSNRRSAGHIPKPAFPPYSRRNNQEGRVVIEYCVNPAGRVTAAFVKTPCPWPLLNQTAVRAVMSGSFPPGGYDTFEITVTFQLN